MTKNWRRQSLTWGKRLIIVALVMAALIYGVLSLAQRSPEALRKGFEDYLTKTTGQRGEITDLSAVRLFPYVYFDMKGINIRDWKDAKKTYVHADSAVIAIPFWRMLFGSATYAKFEIKGLQTATGYFLPQKLDVSFLGISDPSPETAAPQLLVEGKYNALPLLVTMELVRKATDRGPLYTFSRNSLTTFKLGKTEGEGIIARKFTSVSLESARLERGDMAAEFTAESIESDPLNSAISGTINSVPFNALLTEEGENIVLQITPGSDSAEDLRKVKSFVDSVMKDLGLTGDASKIRVTIAGLPNEPAKVETTKDSKEK